MHPQTSCLKWLLQQVKGRREGWLNIKHWTLDLRPRGRSDTGHKIFKKRKRSLKSEKVYTSSEVPTLKHASES